MGVTLTRRQRERIAAAVVEGRCNCCGHRIITWTPEQIVLALFEFVDTHDRVPKASEWREGAADHPAQSSVAQMFGSWNRLLAAAGLADRAMWEKPTIWTREMVVAAILDFRVRENRWPVFRDWTKAKEGGRGSMGRPSAFTVAKLFGGWKAAILYASGVTDPTLPAESLTFEEGCRGCGADRDSNTIGCVTCGDRARRRALRVERKLEIGRAHV